MRSDRRSRKAILCQLKLSRWKKMVRTMEPDAVAQWIEKWIELDHCITTNDRDGQRKAANDIARILFRNAE